MLTEILFYTVLCALTVLNLSGFIITAVDKYKAKKKLWRIPEKVFFILAILGACPGIYAGLLLFRHKTRHWYFMIGIPLIFFLQIITIIAVLFF